MKSKLAKIFSAIPKNSRHYKWLNLWLIIPWIGLVVLANLVILGVIFAVFFLYYSGKIYPGVYVHNIALGGRSLDQAQILLSSQLNNSFPRVVTLQFQDRSWSIPAASISAHPDYYLTVQESLRIGRKGTIVGNTQAVLQALWKRIELPLKITVDEDLLHKEIANLANDIDIPVEEPALLIKMPSGKTIVDISPGRDGRHLETDQVAILIKQRLSTRSTQPITLPVRHIQLSVTPQKLSQAKSRADSILGKTLTLSTDETSVNLSGVELIPFISVYGGFDQNKIASFTATLASQVNKPPQDAQFQFANGKVVTFHPSKDGVVVDQPSTINTLTTTFSSLESTSSSNLTLAVTSKSIPPKITTGQANSLGIKELIGRGDSYFSGSANERIHNLTLLSTKLNGALIPPGEIFSMAKTAGDISAATGYKQAYIIKNGRTVLDDGGGVCQPSTTLFRAALNAGLPIEERHPHAYRVHYSEEGGFQPGMDATIFLPDVDLKFKNDTPAHILIQTHIDNAKEQLTFDLYGTKDNRQVTLSSVRVWDFAPAPPPLYQDEPTLPKGTVKQVDFAAGGAKAAFDYKVTKDGKIIQEKTFFTNYRPWQAIFLKGTKE